MTEKEHLEYVDIDGRIILKCKLKKLVEGMDWNDLAQDRIRWQATVNEVMNLRVPQNARTKKKGTCSTKLVGLLVG